MRSYFSFKGRMGRSAYLNWYLTVGSFLALQLTLLEVAGRFGFAGHLPLALTGAAAGTALAGMLFAVVRRLHDLDRPAWHLVYLLVPVYNVYLLLSLLCMRGEEPINPYGCRPEAL